jgi:E-phenylitaconyl-CoA hydratase
VTADGLLVDVADGVAWLTLDRPESRNALNRALRAALNETLARLDADGDVRVIVLTGTDPAFCAGVDLKEGAAQPDGHPLAEAAAPVTAGLDALRKPAIAAINGPAYGGGFELALACDIRIAAETARFALTELRIGSFPGSGGLQRLARIVAPPVAAQLVLTGDPMAADEALGTGLVSEVVPAADLRQRAGAIAARIAANAPLSVLAAKQSLRAAYEIPLSAGLVHDRNLWAWLAQSEDRAEGREAFREGRPPTFRGR